MKARFFKSNIYALLIFVLISTFFCLGKSITHVYAYGYGTNVLTNPQPTSNVGGWSVTRAEYNNGSYGGEFKGTTNDPMYIYQTFTFSERDKYRINNDEIQISASGYFWSQSSCTMWAYLKANFYNGSGGKIGEKVIEYGKYKVGAHNEQLSFNDYTVPKGTAYIIYEAKNDDSLSGYHPSMRQFVLMVKDTKAPVYIATIPETVPAKYKMGTKIRYKVQFTEAVNVTSQGFLKFKLGTQEFNTTSNTNCTYAGQSADGTTLYYDLTLPSTDNLGDNLPVTITGLSSIQVKDDAGNACTTIPATLNLSNGFYVDNKPPQVTSFTASASTNAVYKAGETLQFDATFHENIWVQGTPKVNLSNGKSATYIKKTDTDTNITSFFYTIAAGDDVKNIGITSIDFNGIRDSVSNYATASPTYSTGAYNSFMNNKYVSIDTTAPTTSFAAAPSGWQKAYDMILSPTDNISGVKEIYAAWTSVGGTPVYPTAANVDTSTNKIILPSKSGTYELYVKLVDEAGNAGTQKSPYTYYFDLEAPTINVDVAKISGTDLVSSVTANAADGHSGINNFTYAWVNEKGITTLTGNVADGIEIPTGDGVYTLTIKATDQIGNESTNTINNLAVDSMPPVVTFASREGVAYKQSYPVNFTVTDGKSGVEGYYYIFNTSAIRPAADSAEWLATNATSLQTPPGVSGSYYLHIKAVDKVGNVSITSTDGFNIDNVAPSISLSQNGNAGIIGEASYDVVITMSDDMTLYDGLTKKYALAESETCPKELLDLTDTSITIEKLDKTKYLYIVVVDQAGNETVFKSAPFIADITPPSGAISKKSNVDYINSSTVNLNITAEDNYSSDIYMQIKIDGSEGAWEDYAEEKTVSFVAVEGAHAIAIRFKDVCGNISEYKSVSYYYDITPPQIELNYSTTVLTNQAVTVTATAKDSASAAGFETVSEKTFHENGSFEFIAKDEAGNRAKAAATVDYIDKTNPTITFESAECDGKKHKTASVKINAGDANGIKELKYAVVKKGGIADNFSPCLNGASIKISDLDGEYSIWAIAVDQAGNSQEQSSQSIYLDNVVPTGTIQYSPSTRTAQNVIATISFDEAATIINNDGSNKFTFPDNGSFTFEFEDEAGNKGNETAAVDWIDRREPEVTLTLTKQNGDILESDEWINTDVIAKINFSDDCAIEVLQFNNEDALDSGNVIDLGNNQYQISGYGRLHYQVKDIVTGTKTSGEAMIRIDKNSPEITDIAYSEEAWTNNDVTVTITAEDDYNDVVYVNGISHTFTENGDFDFIVEDSLGNRTTKAVTITNIDKDIPQAQIAYDQTDLTKENVKAAISFDEGGSPVRITNNNGSDTYVFTTNGEFVFEFKDEAGNGGNIKASVNNIDKVLPEIVLESDYFDLKPHKSVSVKIVAADANGIDEIKYRFTKKGGSSDYEFCENEAIVTLSDVDGIYVLEVVAADNPGNEKRKVSESLILDNTAPEGDITYAPASRTAQNVVATVDFDEPAIITNNDGSPEYTFTDNGDFDFEFADEAGNADTVRASVYWIDRNQPTAEVVLSHENWTSEDVTVTLTPEEGAIIQNVKFNGADIGETAENQYLITEYGTISYEVFDLTTETLGIGEILIKIDRDAPDVSKIIYSTEGWTTKDVTVTLTATDDLSSVIYENGNSYTFTENGDYDFYIKDSAGNQRTKTVTVDWIDRDAPVAEFSYDNTNLTNQNVTAKITFDQGGSPVEVTNNNGRNTYEFTSNGEFTFEFADQAGNTGKAAAKVLNIDKVLPEITFKSAHFDLKKYKSVDVVINAGDENGISDLAYKFVKIGADTGEFIPCQNGEKVTLSDVSGLYQIIARATDQAGNQKITSSQSLYLDNSVPVATIKYSPATRTAQNVIATITFDEKATITNNGGSANYSFSDNGEFTFEFKDDLDNSSTETARVDWIDRTKPTSKIVVTNQKGDVIGESWTNADVTASIIPSPNAAIEDVRFNDIPVENADLIKDMGNNQYKVSGYGRLTYTVKDSDTYLTNTGEALIKVDKTAPIVKDTNYSLKEWTNKNVTVTIKGEDDLGAVSYPENSSHTFTENGSYKFIIEDNAGNRAEETVTVDWIDKDIPVAEITYYVDGARYDIAKPTNKNIVAKITFNEGGSPVRVTNNGGSGEYEFGANGSFTFMFTDSAGNTSSMAAAVAKIDKAAPQGYVTYSYTGWTNKDVSATLVAEDDANEVMITNNPSPVYTFTENGSFIFEFRDSAGNVGTAVANVSKIDKVPPRLSYKLSTNEKTPFAVYAFLEADEPITIVNNEGKTFRQFNANGELTFVAKDRAGNTSEIIAVVSNISRETTPVVLTYSKTTPTNEDVYVTVAPKDENIMIYVTNNNGQKTKKFIENGEFVFNYINAASIIGETVASVSNIDKVPPQVSATYSHVEITKEDVIATLGADKEVSYPYFVVDGKYKFTENMKLQIPVQDQVGNITYKTIETNLIDKTPPEIKIDQQYQVLKLGAQFDPHAGVTAVDNMGLNGDMSVSGNYDPNAAGDYVIAYTAVDQAGNVSIKEKYLTVYDPNQFNVIVNGRMANGGQITLDKRDIVIEAINSGGLLKAKMLPGKKHIGDFKTQGEFIGLSSKLPSPGYYTLYITDDERNGQLVYLFILE